MVYAVTNAAFHAFVRAGVFTEIGDTTFLVRGIGNDEGTFANIFLYQDNGEGDSSTITARDGALIRAAEDGTPMLRLFDGVRLTLRERRRRRRASRTARTRRRWACCVSTSCGCRSATARRRCSGRAASTNANSRSPSSGSGGTTPPPGVRSSDMIAEFNERLVRVLSVPFLPLLGIPLALRSAAQRSLRRALPSAC